MVPYCSCLHSIYVGFSKKVRWAFFKLSFKKGLLSAQAALHDAQKMSIEDLILHLLYLKCISDDGAIGVSLIGVSLYLIDSKHGFGTLDAKPVSATSYLGTAKL
jgi:hypothetical protein